MNTQTRKITILFVLLFSFISVVSVAQTGPGGVGNADGSNSQPENVIWLDANALGLSDGTDVTNWTDKSGNSHIFGASSSGNLPSFESDGSSTINGFPVVRFDDGNAERLVINPFSGFPSSEITTIIIFKTASSAEGIVSYAVSGSDNEYLIFDANSIRTYVDATSAEGGDFNTPSNTENIFITRWTSSGGSIEHYKNGLQVHTDNIESGTTLVDGGSLTIGGEQDAVDGGYAANQDFDGDIAEVIIYGTYLNDAQRTLVENYLSQKYGITLDASATDAYGNGGNFSSAYIYDIAGVGKNGADVHSEGSSAGFYLEVKSDAALNDGDYVMAGHNNGGSSSSTSDLTGTSPTITHRWERDWYLEKTSSSSVGSSVYLEFDFSEGISGGQYPQDLSNYYLLHRSTSSGNYSVVAVTGKTIVNGDRVQFELTEAQLADGYYSIGTSDDTDSPIAGGPGKVWYSYISGNWNDANTWTLDGSSFPDYDNPSGDVPGVQDSVVITDSKTVTIQSTTNNISISGLEVIGTLDLTSSSGHNFTSISGAGIIRLEGASGSANFASATITGFADATTGGTVEIYGSGLDLDAPLTLNNLIINLDNATDEVNLMADYTLNGGLDIQVGTLQIDDGTAGTDLGMVVYGDVLVQSNGNVRVGNANQRHQIDLYGDFTNQGTTYFTNRTTADYSNEATDGIVDVNFLNTSADQQIQCNGECRFYRIEIDKAEATDGNATYILDINASSTTNFNLLGYAGDGHANTAQLTDNDNALGLLSGTVRINANVVVDVLNNTGNYNISERARLWVNGGEVHKIAGSSTVPYGTIKISNGILESDVSSGVTIRDDGQVIIEGGQLLTRQIRTSILGSSNVGGYTQSGGSVILDGTGGTQSDYSMFSMTYPENVFSMTGGTLTIRNTTGNGVIFINSDSYNVTGGEVLVEVSNNSTTSIDTKAPLYNLTLEKTSTSTTGMEVELVAITGEGSEDETVGATELYIINDLRLKSSAGGFDTQLDARQVDILIGGDLYLEQGSNLQSPSNEEAAADNGIIKFVDSGERVIDLDNQTSTITLQYLTVAKDNSADKVTIINAPATALQIQGELRVERGALDYGTYTVEAQDNLYVTDSIGLSGSTGKLLLNSGSAQTITTTSAGGTIRNLELDNSNGFTLLGGDLTVVDQLALTNGLFDIGTNGLILQGNLASETKTDYSATTMIQVAGNASDGGFNRLINANSTFLYPMGTNANATTRYTPAEVAFTGVSDDGYVAIHPVDKTLETTNTSGGDVLSYYWNVTHQDFASVPTVIYQFDYDESDLDGSSNESSFVGGSVLDETPYTRYYEDEGVPESENIDDVNNIITFNGDGDAGFTLEQANYTAGEASRFTGSPTVYYSRVANGNWNQSSTWSTVGYGGAAAAASPGAGDIVHIGYSGSPGSYQRHRVTLNTGSSGSPHEIAELILEQNPDAGLAESEMSRLIISPNRGLRVTGRIRGDGEIQFQMANSGIPTLDADMGEFADTDGASFIMRVNSGNLTAPSNLTEFPRLSIPGSSQSYSNSRSLTFDTDITCKNLNIRYGGTLLMGTGAGGDIYVEDSLRIGAIGSNNEGRIIFQNSGNARTITVGGGFYD